MFLVLHFAENWTEETNLQISREQIIMKYKKVSCQPFKHNIVV